MYKKKYAKNKKRLKRKDIKIIDIKSKFKFFDALSFDVVIENTSVFFKSFNFIRSFKQLLTFGTKLSLIRKISLLFN